MGGMNNQGYRFRHSTGEAFLKHYRSPDRGQREELIFRLLEVHEISQVPALLALNLPLQLGLFEFVEGEVLSSASREDCAQALLLLRQMQTLPGREVPPAVDGCLSIREHWRSIESRLEQLQPLLNSRALAVWQEVWRPLWERLRNRTLPADVAPGECLVSPSDYGFHNCLRRRDGNLCFFDFEYAGLDDPAKLFCDFFAQPRVPAPLSALTDFWDWLPPASRPRTAWLWPATCLKWSGIVLRRLCHPEDLQRASVTTEQQMNKLGWLEGRRREVEAWLLQRTPSPDC